MGDTGTGVAYPTGEGGGRPRSVDMREIVNAIFYLLRSGCSWQLLPHDLPNWKTVYDYYRQWRQNGEWELMNTALRVELRIALGREATPSAMSVGSQSVKTTEKGGHGASMGEAHQRSETLHKHECAG